MSRLRSMALGGGWIGLWGAACLLGSAPAWAKVIDYPIGPESADIRFHTEVARVVPVDGAFTSFAGHILFDTAHPSEVSIDVVVDDAAMTVPFGGAQTLRSPPYFDHASFPTIHFQSDQVQVTAQDRFTVTGRLTIRGVTRPATLQGVMTHLTLSGVAAMRVSATSTLDRTSFGMVADRPLIADQVDLHITATLRAP